jgi:hypothetical protein
MAPMMAESTKNLTYCADLSTFRTISAIGDLAKSAAQWCAGLLLAKGVPDAVV